MHLNVGEHYIVNLLGLDVHMDTLITLWLAMGIILFFSILAVSKINIIPNKIQAVFENIVTLFVGLTKDLGKNQGSSALVLMCIFLLIITGNLIGQLPFRLIHLPQGELAAPTNDINTTAALAVFVLIYYIYKGIKAKGLSYFKHYVQPVWFMAPFNILEDFTRPLTLAIRLFANILAGEILIMVSSLLLASILTPDIVNNLVFTLFKCSIIALIAVSIFIKILPKKIYKNLCIVFAVITLILGAAMLLPQNIQYNIGLFMGSLLPLPFMFFELFVAFIQALVFTLLTSAYIQGAAAENH